MQPQESQPRLQFCLRVNDLEVSTTEYIAKSWIPLLMLALNLLYLSFCFILNFLEEIAEVIFYACALSHKVTTITLHGEVFFLHREAPG